MKIHKRNMIARWIMLGWLLPLALSAQAAARPDNLQVLEDIPPPPKVIEGQPMETPKVNKYKKGEDTVEEYRISGELYMMKITPAKGPAYYLHRDQPNGEWVKDGPTPPVSIPHWILFKF